jgi:hypothetical protein
LALARVLREIRLRMPLLRPKTFAKTYYDATESEAEKSEVW